MDRMHSTYMGRAVCVHGRAVDRRCLNLVQLITLALAHGVLFLKDVDVNT